MELNQYSMRLQWTPWVSMELPWNSTKVLVVSMEPHGTPWSFHETPWNSMELPWSSMELQVIPWSFHGTPWGFHRIPWNSMKLHGILWNSMEFHGIPWSYFTRAVKSSDHGVETFSLNEVELFPAYCMCLLLFYISVCKSYLVTISKLLLAMRSLSQLKNLYTSCKDIGRIWSSNKIEQFAYTSDQCRLLTTCIVSSAMKVILLAIWTQELGLY